MYAYNTERVLLERARAAIAAPAETTAFTDFHPNDRTWLIRVTDERLRRQGRIQDLVVRMLRRGEEPTLDDLAAAIEQPQPIPKAVLDRVRLELPIPALIPGFGNVAWHAASVLR